MGVDPPNMPPGGGPPPGGPPPGGPPPRGPPGPGSPRTPPIPGGGAFLSTGPDSPRLPKPHVRDRRKLRFTAPGPLPALRPIIAAPAAGDKVEASESRHILHRCAPILAIRRIPPPQFRPGHDDDPSRFGGAGVHRDQNAVTGPQVGRACGHGVFQRGLFGRHFLHERRRGDS